MAEFECESAAFVCVLAGRARVRRLAQRRPWVSARFCCASRHNTNAMSNEEHEIVEKQQHNIPNSCRGGALRGGAQ